MKKLIFICGMFLLQLGLVLNPASGAIQQDPSQVVRESVDKVLSTIEEQKKRNGNEVTEEMVRELLSIMETVVDFGSFTRSVMGKHAKQASAEQKEAFKNVFIDSLVSFYRKSFLTFEIREVEVFDQEPDFDPTKGRASVRLVATDTDNNSYEVRYTMRTDQDGAWKVRNFIIEGINVGLTFLNQFDGAMAAHNNDIDQVIANWTAEIDREELKK